MKDMDGIATELNLPSSQILAKFYEACKKINATINYILEDTVAKTIGLEDKTAEDLPTNGPVKESLQDELSKAAKVSLCICCILLGYYIFKLNK